MCIFYCVCPLQDALRIWEMVFEFWEVNIYHISIYNSSQNNVLVYRDRYGTIEYSLEKEDTVLAKTRQKISLYM